MMAGLLTDSPPGTFPTPPYGRQWHKVISWKLKWSFTAAGLSGILTRFPFNPLPVYMGIRNQFGGKDRRKIRLLCMQNGKNTGKGQDSFILPIPTANAKSDKTFEKGQFRRIKTYPFIGGAKIRDSPTCAKESPYNLSARQALIMKAGLSYPAHYRHRRHTTFHRQENRRCR